MAPPLTDAELDEIDARANAATEGPWEIDSARDVIGQMGDGDVYRHTVAFACDMLAAETVADEDIAFIVSARTDIPRLVAEVRELRALLSHVSSTGRLSLRDTNLVQNRLGDTHAEDPA